MIVVIIQPLGELKALRGSGLLVKKYKIAGKPS